jgi:hypothetical protein
VIYQLPSIESSATERRSMTSARVLGELESNELLDLLDDPVKSVRVCELGERNSSTTLRRLDRAELDKWREDYRGVGDLRAHGYLRQVVSGE